MAEYYAGNKPILYVDSIYGTPQKRTGHFGVLYRGINYVKCPFDYVLYQMVLNLIKPDLVIEIGTFNGGGALYLADILEKIGEGGIVHTIDLEEKTYDEKIKNNPYIKCYFGGYQSYDLKECEGYSNILVIDDGSHVYEDVRDAFIKFNPLVKAGGYYIIEDGIASGDPALNGGPNRFVAEIFSYSDRFNVNLDICDFFGKGATFNPNGYLVAVK